MTGEIVEGERTKQLARAERFALVAVAREILGKEHRTGKCMQRRVPKQTAKVWKDKEHGKAFYSGVRTCAALWTCAHCAAKISERRRVELVGALAAAKRLGLHVKLLTLTIPHGIGDDVKVIVRKLMAAWKRTTNGKAAKDLRDLLGLRGTIRAFEVTYGANGFHPHLHVLLFLDKSWSNASVHAAFSPLWQNACRLAGLPIPSDAHGCRVDDGSKAAAYASKWGLESEMTKGHIKRGKQGGMTPFDFLRAVLADDQDAPKFRGLFRAYADAFHGQRQLYWSNGLRALLELGKEATDEELAAEQTEQATMLAELLPDEWRAIVHARAQAAVLDVAEDKPEKLRALLDALYARWLEYSRRRGTVCRA
ncbi:protein rep [Azotobacter salinestris]|uniref:protein rep n=1 Tax=Azotobacter salinestris TaxID=69964 RepID=UPI0032DE5598